MKTDPAVGEVFLWPEALVPVIAIVEHHTHDI